MIHWAIITGEYPPQSGGVSDYTYLVANGLVSAGDKVTVFAPPIESSELQNSNLIVIRLPGHFGIRSLYVLECELRRICPDRILVQYVPHAYGLKAMNLPFAFWLAGRARRIAPLWIMFHEVTFPFSWRPLKYALLGSVNNLMARLIAEAADRIFVSIPSWENTIRLLCHRTKRSEWLPIPSNIGTETTSIEIASAKTKLTTQAGIHLVGHFGTYGKSITALLSPIIKSVISGNQASLIVLFGRGSKEYAADFIGNNPLFANRVKSTGELSLDELPVYLKSCDLLIQPFPDGISSRRTSAMAGLANGVPIVTNIGHLSENFWLQGAVIAASKPDPEAIAKLALVTLNNTIALRELSIRGANLYQNTFALEHTIKMLRS